MTAATDRSQLLRAVADAKRAVEENPRPETYSTCMGASGCERAARCAPNGALPVMLNRAASEWSFSDDRKSPTVPQSCLPAQRSRATPGPCPAAFPRPTAAVRWNCSPSARRKAAARHLVRAHGFTAEQLVELVRLGLATATADRVAAGGRKFEVATLRIADAGRRALSGMKS